MNRTKVYDLPTRLFHGLFAGIFAAAFLIAKQVDAFSPFFSYHMLLGLVLSVVVCLRILWGIVGSKYARFSSFALHPASLVQYVLELFSRSPSRILGHNAASSWAAVLMMGLALALAVTGYLMTAGGQKEVLEDSHELLANAFAVIVILHVAGVGLHSLRHRDSIGLAMVHGKKKSIEGQAGIERSHGMIAVLFLVTVGAFVFYLSQNYNSATREITFLGRTFHLGEADSDVAPEN